MPAIKSATAGDVMNCPSADFVAVAEAGTAEPIAVVTNLAGMGAPYKNI
jgi:hypothetical protein